MNLIGARSVPPNFLARYLKTPAIEALGRRETTGVSQAWSMKSLYQTRVAIFGSAKDLAKFRCSDPRLDGIFEPMATL